MMRIILVIAYLFMLIPMKTYAQDSLVLQKNRKSFSISFYGGLNLLTTRGGVTYKTFEFESVVSMQPPTNSEYYLQKVNRVGYSVGVNMMYGFTKHFQLFTRLGFEEKKLQINQVWNNISFDSVNNASFTYMGMTANSVKNNYIVVSILPQYSFAKHFTIGAGGYLEYLVYSHTWTVYHLTQLYTPAYVFPYRFKKYNYGLSLNIGYTYSYKQFAFSIQLIDSYGLNKVPTIYDGLKNYKPWHDNTYSILLGIRYYRINKRISQTFKNKLYEH